MLYEGYIIRESGRVNVFEIDSIRNFNQHITDIYTKSVERLEKELLSLHDLLMVDGDLLRERN